ncbi:DUF3322 and DUF2220 domain-containing protein [Microbacterium sp.]|uniref:Wadjet anti-phage system protein JetD domain-containing protein n=1 Tax=Microbacterium sp. TaxID=51671 RepID=UPI0025D65112|nr:DUF3322 and DUF2220 domain-containing protein [Microbacterium sp.]
MTDPARWTTPAGVAAVVRRRWDDGMLPRAFALDEPFPRVEVPLRGPSAADLGEYFDAARAWADAVNRGSRDGRAYHVLRGRIGGRLAGVTELPTRAVVESYAQAWQLLGTARDADAFRAVVAASLDVPTARAWALTSPQRAVALAGEWATLLSAHRWLADHRDSGRYLREVSAPGVDTKFIERHRSVLAAMLGVPSDATRFAEALGFAVKPATVRLRCDPAVVGLPSGVTEATLRVDELDRLRARPDRALIVENEVTYLSVPVPDGSVVLWGKGYDADRAASLPWLADVPVLYWGDIDTHGFGILHRVRAHLPHARSILMDRETLLAHEGRWGSESVPTTTAMTGLDPAETALYTDLVTDRFGSAVRLEQERIDWAWAMGRLRDAGW